MRNMEKEPYTVTGRERAAIVPDTVQAIKEENEDDTFCLKLYEEYLMNQENEETVSFEDAVQQLGISIE